MFAAGLQALLTLIELRKLMTRNIVDFDDF